MMNPIFEHKPRARPPLGHYSLTIESIRGLRWLAESAMCEMHGAIVIHSPKFAYDAARRLFGHLREIEYRELEAWK